MPESRKYLSKIVKDRNTIYMKDEEARQAIAALDPAEAEPTSSATSMWNNYNIR